jgi:hypothetical protein
MTSRIASSGDRNRASLLMKLYAGQHRLATQIHPRVRVGLFSRGEAEGRGEPQRTSVLPMSSADEAELS